MIILREITVHDSVCADIQVLYESAFPADERRDFAAWLQLLEHEPAFRVVAVYDDNAFAGFISFWQWENWRYAEHFAIDGSRRGGGIGAAAFQQFLQMDSRPLIGEVELPTDNIAQRRIAFYERLGLVSHPDYTYIQPPYSADKSALQLLLMTYGAPADVDLSQPVQLLRKYVYGVKNYQTSSLVSLSVGG